MRTYTIFPLQFSEGQDYEQSEVTADGTHIIICPTAHWAWGDAKDGDRYRVAVLNPDTHHWADRFDLDSTPYPTFEAAVEAANEIHRKAVEKFLEPAQVSMEPIGEKHRDGNPYLTDDGIVVWMGEMEAGQWGRPSGWYTASSLSCAGVLACAQDGPWTARPTLVITIHH